MKQPPLKCPLCGEAIRGGVAAQRRWNWFAGHVHGEHNIPLGGEWPARFMGHLERGTLTEHLQEQQLIKLLTQRPV